jgi:hypothetical protein
MGEDETPQAQADYSPFCSRTVTRHLLRGLAGLVLVVWAFANAAAHPVLAIVAGITAIFAWRGCPMCWTIGLVETLARRLKSGRTSSGPA